MPSYWRPISPITLKPPVVKSFRSSSSATRWPGAIPLLKAVPGMTRAGRGVFPFLHALGIAENNRGDVEALHFGEDVFHILAGRRRDRARECIAPSPSRTALPSL